MSQKIIVSCLGGIGDAVILTPLLRGIKRAFPQCKLITVTFPHSVEVLSNSSLVDTAIGFDKSFNNQWEIVTKCWGADLVFCVDTAHRLPVLYTLAGVKNRIGLPHKRAKWLTHLLAWETWMDCEFDPIVKAELFKQGTGIDIRQTEGWEKFDYPEAPDQSKKRLDALLIQEGIEHYLVCSLETGVWYKDWPVEHWLSLFAWLKARNRNVIIVGAQSKKLSDLIFPDNVLDLRGKTSLLELGYIIKKADLMVNGCSLPVHVANAFEVPVIGLYGSQPAKRGAPPKIFAAIESSAPCAPCNVPGKSACDKPFCMKLITPEIVEKEICRFYGWSKA